MGAAIVYQQYQELKEKYPDLQLKSDETGLLWIEGQLHFIGDYHGVQIEDAYTIKMLPPEVYPHSLPVALEIGNKIPKNFHHYADGSLCLGARYALWKAFQEQPTLLGFTEKCLLPYLYSYSYKIRHGKLPIGELSHGWLGVIEYYQELFRVSDGKAALGLIKILAGGKCGGHARCPCGSRKRIRDCHGGMLKNILQVQAASFFQGEYQMLVAGIARERKP